ncbi:MAG: MurR/RpiR family transcriptional regulator, partial [Halanaerobiales bacterium]
MSINQNSRESIAKIKNAYHSLPRSEKKVADFILNQPEEIIYLSVSELAKNCQVSDSTIIRFCKDVGFNGYQEFKLMLAQDLVIPVENINETITVDDNLKTIISKLAYINKKAIEETMDILNISELDHAINSII